ncbi:MAG: endonuclease/exonuclease/phosphatase family protein [Mycobacterium sp.]
MGGSHRRLVRTFLAALAVFILVFAVITVAVRSRPLSNVIGLVVAVGSPYTTLLVVMVLAVMIICRRLILALIAVVIVCANVVIQVPWYYFGQPPNVAEHLDLRVLSSNLRKGQVDAVQFVRLATTGADVITVSELTSAAVAEFDSAGIGSAFPFAALIPGDGASGIGLWSRYPFVVESRTMGAVAVRLQIDGLRHDPLVASMHVTNPLARNGRPSFDDWLNGITAAKADLHGFADAAGPAAVIVAGDFNSTPDLRQFRDLLTNGYRDAVEQVGAGFAPTFPSYRPWWPPLITIDHLLTRQAAASSIRTVYLHGTDHRALLATVEVPVDPTAS